MLPLPYPRGIQLAAWLIEAMEKHHGQQECRDSTLGALDASTEGYRIKKVKLAVPTFPSAPTVS